jgi:hypothetical protein
MADFYVDDILSEGGLTATTLTSNSVYSTDFSATTYYGSGSGLTNLSVDASTLTLVSPNNSIQFNNNGSLSGTNNFLYSGHTLSFTGTTYLDGLFYIINSPSVKIAHQWAGSITAGAAPGIVWTNMPVLTSTWLHTTSGTLTGDATFITDLTEYTECRLFTSLQALPNTGSSLTVQNSLNNSSWNTLVSVQLSPLSGATTGVKDSGWTSISTSANTFNYIRLVGSGGNGVADPRFSPPILLVR